MLRGPPGGLIRRYDAEVKNEERWQRVGTVREIWRFPVKSLGGERVDAAEVDRLGVRGDRLWAVRDEEHRVITNAKKIPALLLCSARYAAEPGADAVPGAIPPAIITLPGGEELSTGDPAVHERLSGFLGRRVTVSALRPESDREYYRAEKSTAGEMREQFAVAAEEPLPDFSMMSVAKLMELAKYATPPGTHFDVAALHVVSTATMAALRGKAPGSDFDVRRFRPNLVIESAVDAFAEVGWQGGALHAGTLVARVEFPTVRCSMTIRPQPGLDGDPRILKTIVAEAERCLGVYAAVTTPGRVAVGDEVGVDAPKISKLAGLARAAGTSVKRVLLRAALPKK